MPAQRIYRYMRIKSWSQEESIPGAWGVGEISDTYEEVEEVLMSKILAGICHRCHGLRLRDGIFETIFVDK